MKAAQLQYNVTTEQHNTNH